MRASCAALEAEVQLLKQVSETGVIRAIKVIRVIRVSRKQVSETGVIRAIQVIKGSR